jgi:hypothetical protein
MNAQAMNEYMYMFVDQRLSTPQKIIQVAHAAAKIGENYHGNTYATLCGAKDEDHLKAISEYLDTHGIDHHCFFEPDIGQYTAIATQPLKGEARYPLKKFSLLT